MTRTELRLCRWTLVVASLLTFPACQPRQQSPEEGVYTSSREVFLFHAEVLELARGRFRYWFLSDIPSPDPVEWPITGKYRREGDRIYLETRHDLPHPRLIVEVSGTTCLLRDDAEQGWRQAKRTIFPYGWLVRVPYSAEQTVAFARAEYVPRAMTRFSASRNSDGSVCQSSKISSRLASAM